MALCFTKSYASVDSQSQSFVGENALKDLCGNVTGRGVTKVGWFIIRSPTLSSSYSSACVVGKL